MFVEGKIKTYNDERGFGFIQIEGERKDLFFHIKDLPNKQIQPKVGERLKFRIVDDQGKLKAENIERLDLPTQSHKTSNKHSNHRQHPKKSSGGGVGFFIVVMIVASLGYMLYGQFQSSEGDHQTSTQTLVQQPTTTDRSVVNSNPNNYVCDGRTYCSQMNSREEARWFTRNCPNTKMDGNNDGEPCEQDTRW